MSSNAIEYSQQIGWVLKNHKATWFLYQNHSLSCVNTGGCTTQLTFFIVNGYSMWDPKNVHTTNKTLLVSMRKITTLVLKNYFNAHPT